MRFRRRRERTQLDIDLEQAMRAIDPPRVTIDPVEREWQRRDAYFVASDRYDDLMNGAAAIIVGALTAAFIWNYADSLTIGVVIGILWGGLLYASVGWAQEKRRRWRDRQWRGQPGDPGV